MVIAEPDVSDQQAVVSIGNLSLNLDNYRVAIGGDVIDLTYHEIELLHIFVENADRVVSYETLARAIWGNAERVSVRHLNVLVHRLRSKLAGSDPYWIETVRGRGYGLLAAREPMGSFARSNTSVESPVPFVEVSRRTEARQ